ncbi:putative bicarbonate transporter, IctB family [Microcoleus sp. FACHB-1515]|uniref:IctB family putative bicarbonate transporter n=1 Tax=Cyanophyceae TaxID=3028117 RepID=UPI0016854C1F|nr:IctB family putative bicarbonate transporter [Microcoleus sp. FACHB-1515]MBD2091104.1 putative bicarbonate transporter, IctB family [Microcoleus sp. FACHB-1515]
MNPWQQITLMNLPLSQWSKASYVQAWIGLLQSWRRSSWLMQRADAIGGILLILVFAFAPFVSTALIGVLLIACGGYWLLLTLSDDKRIGFTPIHLVVLLYWGISIAATALSPVKSAALIGCGRLTLYLLMFALAVRVLRSPRLRSILILVYLLVAVFVSVFGLRQWFFGADALATWVDAESTLAGTTRVYSFLGNPNLLAAYLLPAVVFSGAAIFAWRRWTAKAMALLLTVTNAACLVLTFSRGGWIGFVVASFVGMMLLVHWFSVYLPRLWRRLALPIVLGMSAAVVVLAVATVEPLRDRVASIFVGREDSSNNYRINVWSGVVKMIRDRPIIGIGPGNSAFNRVYPRYQRTGFSALSAYSILLEVLVETGIIGFTCFLWLLLVTFNQGWVQLQRLRTARNAAGFWLMAAIATMVGMLAHGLVDTVWYRPQVSTLWWLMVALIASFYQPVPKDLAVESGSIEK